MGLSLSSLLAQTTPEEAEADLIEALTIFGFPATSWQPKSVPYTLLKWFATKYASLTSTVAVISAGGFLATSAILKNSDGSDLIDWLDLYAVSQYDEVRAAATSTSGQMILTNQSGSPHTFVVGQLWTTDSGGRLFNNTTGGTLDAANGSTLTLVWKAESPGATYNIPNGTIGSELATPIPGVTVTNPAVGSTGTWITSAGRDIEGNASYATRARTKWSSLGTGAGGDAYIYWAKTGAPTVTRVAVDEASPDGPGTIRVYLANAVGPATSPEVAAADAYIQSRRALGMKVTTQAAVAQAITITATIEVLTAYASTAPGLAASNIAALVAGLDIGEDLYTSEIITALSTPAGVRRVTLTLPATDVVTANNAVVTATLNLTTVIV
jgi:hypothetical protein